MVLAVYPVCGASGESLFEQAEIQGFGLTEHPIYRELIRDPPSRSLAEGVGHFGFIQEPADSIGDLVGVFDRNQETRPAVFNEFRVSSHARRDNRDGRCHGFQDNVREPFSERWVYHNIDVPQDLRHILALTREDHAVIEPQLPSERLHLRPVIRLRGTGADHKKPDVPPAFQNYARSTQVKVDALSRHQAADTRANRGFSRNTEFFAQRAQPGRSFRARRQDNAVSNNLDLLFFHTLFDQPIPPCAAVGNYAVSQATREL